MNTKDKEAIKQLFKNQKCMNRRLEKELGSFGIRVERGKRHYKLYFKNEMFIFSCSPSDYREGRNIAAMICRAM